MKKVAVSRKIILLVVLITLSATDRSGRTIAQYGYNQENEITQRLNQLLPEYTARHNTFGILWARLDAEDFSIFTAGEIRESDHLRIASVSKTFLSFIFLKEGLDPNKPISSIFPEEQFPHAGLITPGHLLNHTSGIPDELTHHTRSMGINADPEVVLEAMREFIAAPAPSPRERIPEIYNHDTGLEFTPGTHWCYSNTGYIIIGYMLEKKTGMTADELLQKHFGNIAPGMYLDDGRTSVFPASYPTPWPVHSTGPWVAGGMIATAHDVLQAMSFISTQPEFAHMQQWTSQTRCAMEIVFGDDYGLGLQRYRLAEHGAALGHDGHIMARTFLFYLNGSSYLLHTTNYISNAELKAIAEELLPLM